MNVLAIDQAERSGWSFWRDGKHAHSGEAKGTRQCQAALEIVLALSPGDDPKTLRCLVVFEDHSSMRIGGRRKGGRRTYDTSAATLLGMGRPHGWWEMLLDQANHDDRARVKVAPQTWKGKVLGMANGNRDDSIEAAQRHAVALGARNPGPDEAVAMVMGHWATKAPEAIAAWERAYGAKARKRKAAA